MKEPFPAIIGTRDERERYVILQLQRHLRRLTDPGLIASGIWDGRSRDALARFQADRNLTVTGVADLETFTVLIAEGEAARLAVADLPALPLPPFAPEGGVLAPGQSGDAVTLVQIILNRFLITLTDRPPLSVNGRLDAQTADAVRLFRCVHGLPEGDTVDRAVWELLTASFGAPAAFE